MNGYGSRKFIGTMVIVFLTTFLAYIGKLNGDVALVFAAGIASYNVANAYVQGSGNGK